MLQAQSGPQEMFLSCEADIAIYGGAAGSGKSYALLLEILRSTPYSNKFYSVVFRRTTVQIRLPGSLWDQSSEVFGGLPGAVPTENNLEWEWKDGGRCKFAHLEHENTKLDWHGAQVPLICFDELTTFTQSQFFYMLSRNRSMSGVPGYVRATCNPDADSWVAEFIAWWIDQDTGFPITARAGKIRWMLRVGDKLVWADKKEDLTAEKLELPAFTPKGDKIEYMPKSVAFVPATIFDNQELMKKDPSYLANLLALARVERERLLGGNWKIRPAAGLYFNRLWCEVVDAVPADCDFKRGWDLAATEKTQQNDPDYTVGVKVGRSLASKVFYITDMVDTRSSPQKVEVLIKNVMSQDGGMCEQHLPQDPGQSGKAQGAYLTREFAGYTIRFSPETAGGDSKTSASASAKVKRFGPVSAQAEAGNVKILRGKWNETFFNWLEGFPDANHDDHADATSRAFNAFFNAFTGLIDYYQGLANAKRVAMAKEADRSMPTTSSGGVRVKGPPGVNILYDMKGRLLPLDADGNFIVDPKHAEHLKRSPGFTILDK